MAASATFALKAGVWFRRGRLFIVSPDSLAQRARCQAETPLIVLFRFLRPALHSGCVLALIDLDGFKSVNDTYGHGGGDELLKEVGTRIKTVLGGRHFPVRLGGDEFAVVFDRDSDLDNAIGLGNQIVAALKLPYKFGATDLQISGSVGLACFENETDTFSSIMERADNALYQAKNA